MNFLPNTKHYQALSSMIDNSTEFFNGLREIAEDNDNTSLINFDYERLEISPGQLKQTLTDTISSDFQNALESYAETAKMFYEVEKIDYFSKKVGTFPFFQWFALQPVSFMEKFFQRLPPAILHHNLEEAIISYRIYRDDHYFFQHSLEFMMDKPGSHAFLAKLFEKESYYKDYFIVALLFEDFIFANKAAFRLQEIIPEASDYFKKRLSDEKFIEFMLNHPLNIFCTIRREKGENFARNIDWDKLEKLIDTSCEIDISHHLCTKLQKVGRYLITKKSTDNDSDMKKFESLQAYIYQNNLEKILPQKEYKSGFKI